MFRLATRPVVTCGMLTAPEFVLHQTGKAVLSTVWNLLEDLEASEHEVEIDLLCVQTLLEG